MQNIIEILPQNIAIALGFSLLHSIWQSILLLLVFQILNRLLKQNKAKYNISIILIFAQLALSIITYVIIYEPVIENMGLIKTKNTVENYLSNTVLMDNEISNILIVKNWLAANINTLVGLWFLGVFMYLVRFAINIYQIKLLKTNGLRKVNIEINEKFELLIVKMGISKSVKLNESTLVNLPILVGHFKPFILLPVGLSANLTIAELEAILAHELAHLKRHDYLVNLGQSIIEILYFFNPALLYLSVKTRDIRENCCDDFASEICGSKLPIAKALVQIEQFRHDSKLAMAFGRKGSSLKLRIQNLLGVLPEKNKNNSNLIIILLFCFLGVFYFKIENSFAQKPPIKKVPKNTVTYKNKTQVNYQQDQSRRWVELNDKKGNHLVLKQIDGAVYLTWTSQNQKGFNL